jgi:YbbR domain-containing protein
MPFIKLTKLERKRFAIFMLCLICAVGAWFFMALNKKYPYSVITEIVYKNEPQGKAYKALQPDTVTLKVEGTGWQLLFSRLRINPQSISVSLNDLGKSNFVKLSEQLFDINRQLESAQKVKSISPDTLYFDFSKRITKKVPLKLVSNLSFAKQYGISSQIILSPAYISVSGPQEELAKIKFWPTDTLKLKDLQNSVSTRIGIKKNTLGNVTAYPNTIGVKVPIDEFTEKTVAVPLTVYNNTDFYEVNLYPKQVKVTFMVALSSYEDINADFIVSSVNLNEWKIYGHDQLSPTIKRFPPYCKIVKIVPNKVDFIIEK